MIPPMMRMLSTARNSKRLCCIHVCHQQAWRTFVCNKLGFSFKPVTVQRAYSATPTQHAEINERQLYCGLTGCCRFKQRDGWPSMWTSSFAYDAKKTFLSCQPTCAHHHLIRHASTEPTTAYEIILASKPVQLSQTLLESCHDLTGLPWWASLVVSTFLLRATLTFPLGIYSQHIKAKVERLQPEIVLLAKQAFLRRFAERARLEKWSEKRAERTVMRLVKHYSKELFIRDNCHPAKGSILLLVQLPLWICLSLSLRNMTGAFAGTVYLDPANVVPTLSTEGALWFSDLTVADPFLVLPVLVGVLNLCNIEMMALQKNPASRTQRYVTNALRCLSLVMIPIAAYVPAAMTLYWATSAFYGLGQNVIFKSPSARSLLKIPTAPSDSETPFSDMRDALKARFLGGQKEEPVEEKTSGGGRRKAKERKRDT